MNRRRFRLSVVGAVVLIVGVAVWCWRPASANLPEVTAPQGGRGPARIETAAGEVEDTHPRPSPRWEVPDPLPEGERFPPTGDDWNNNGRTFTWVLHVPADVPGLPDAVATELVRLDCRIPRIESSTFVTSQFWGEIEREGQYDLVVLCAHSDGTSTTYVFWAGDATRRDAVPGFGDSVTIADRTRLLHQFEFATSGPIETGMPTMIEHEGIEIACCECCSTLYYRHDGRWYSLPGAD